MKPLHFIAALAALMGTAALLRAAEPGGARDPFIGTLRERKVYRRVNGQPILGHDVGGVLVEQGKNWEEGLNQFAERLLVREEMERRSVTVSADEIEQAIRRSGLAYARQRGEDPRLFTPEKLARLGGTSLHFLREQMRSTLGLKKILIKAGKIPPKSHLDAPAVKKLIEEQLKKLVKEREVEADPKKLGPGEVLRIGGRGYSREQVRAFVLERLGPLRLSQLKHALEVLTLQRLVQAALKAAGAKPRPKDDNAFYLSYRAALQEYDRGIPPGEGGRALQMEIHRKGFTRESFLKDRVIACDVGITRLAREALAKQGEAALRAEWKAHKKKYQHTEKVLAHLFIRVRDPQGRPYTPRWKAPGHERVNRYVARVREERFAARKKDILACLGAARADFSDAVKRFSEDEQTKRDKEIPGLIGRVGPRSLLSGLPVDRALIGQALKLKPGEISAPLRSAYGWHLVKCIEDQQTGYEDARPQIYVMLLKRARVAASKRLLEGAKVEDLF